MIENLGICKGLGSPLVDIQTGRDHIHISRNGRQYHVLLNNRVIGATKSEKELFSKGLPFLISVVKEMARTAGIDQLRWLPTTNIKKDNKMVGDAMKFVKQNLRPTEIFVLQIVPDEIQDQLPKEAAEKRNIFQNLERYKEIIKDFENTVVAVQESSEVLLKTNLAKKMWGSKNVMDIITESRDVMAELLQDYNKMDVCLERSDKASSYLQAAFSRKLANMQVKDVVGGLIENFSFLKSYMSRLAMNLQPLYAIDKDFKAHIGYPATWFFNPTTYLNFTDGYETLVGHLIKTASLESEIFEPLLVWKMTGATL